MLRCVRPRCRPMLCLTGAAWLLLAAFYASVEASDPPQVVFPRLDINRDGVLSGKEAKPYLMFDSDGDGEVTFDEFVSGWNAARKKYLALDDNTLFTQADGNGDGVLSGTEVRGFEDYDFDRDGEVSRKEFDQGRAADRRELGGGVVSPEERSRLAREQFRKLDVNEDGRLSGNEIQGYAKLDANGDGRISEQEFVDGYQPDNAPVVDPVAAFMEMLKITDPTPMLAAADPEFAKEVDPLILMSILTILKGEHGDLKSTAEALTARQENADGVARTVYEGKLNFGEGDKAASVATTIILINGRIAGFELNSPALQGFDQKLYQMIAENAELTKNAARYFTPRVDEFVGLILAGENAKAFGKYHPEVQEQIGRKKADAVFGLLSELCGEFQTIDVERAEVKIDAESGKAENFQITHMVRGSKGAALTTTSFQIVGLTAAIVGLKVQKPDNAGPAPQRIELIPVVPAAPAAPVPAAPAPPPAPAAPAAKPAPRAAPKAPKTSTAPRPNGAPKV